MTIHNPNLSTNQKPHCSQSHGFESKTKNEDTIRRLTYASILCAIFIIVEITGGLLSSSLAVLSDAAHLFADLASFLVAIVAARLATVPPNSSNTFGYHRAEALAALYSMSCLWIVSFFLGVEAIQRGYNFLTMDIITTATVGTTTVGVVVDGKIMSATAAVGVVVNVCLAFILGGDHHHMGHDHDHSHGHDHGNESCSHNDHDESTLIPTLETHDHSQSHDHQAPNEEERSLIITDEENPDSYESIPTTTTKTSSIDNNLNLKAAYLHVLADLLQSLCVFFSGLIIWYNPNWQICDPFITIMFCIFVMKTTYGIIFSSISILMNDVPSSLDWNSIYDAIDSIDGVFNVHDLHIWSITHGSYCLSVHADALDVELATMEIQNVCTGFGIYHTTIQLQPEKGRGSE